MRNSAFCTFPIAFLGNSVSITAALGCLKRAILFFNPASNPNKAQLIATFHTDFLLRDTLHKYQIYLVENDENLHSNAYRLDSMRGVRNVDNLYEKYHAGAFGGIPALP